MANIIDGIDVTKCEHCMYQGFKAFPQCRLNLDSFATACEQHKDCYYKQLKRAEKENETLERTCNELRKRHSEDTTRLSAEVMELKAELQTEKIYSSQIEEIEESLHHEKAENEKLKEEIKLAQELSDQSIEYFGNSREEFKKKSHRYKQALMEIREIAKIHCKACDEFEIKRKLINCPYCNYNKILNKIDEVLNG